MYTTESWDGLLYSSSTATANTFTFYEWEKLNPKGFSYFFKTSQRLSSNARENPVDVGPINKNDMASALKGLTVYQDSQPWKQVWQYMIYS